MQYNSALLERIASGGPAISVQSPEEKQTNALQLQGLAQQNQIRGTQIQDAATGKARDEEEYVQLRKFIEEAAGDPKVYIPKVLAYPWRNTEIPQKFQGVARDLQAAATAKAQQDNIGVDNARADALKDNTIANSKAEEARKVAEVTQKQAQEAAGVIVPGTKGTFKIDGKVQEGAMYSVRSADGSYHQELRALGEAAAAPQNPPQPQAAMSPERFKQQQDLAAAAAANRAPASEPLVPTTDEAGNTTYTPRSQAAGMNVPVSSNNKPSTGVEKRVLTFYIRAKDADENVKTMEPEIQALKLGGQTWMQIMPNFAQTQLGQNYRQAQRAFTEARLRKDSGAAIPPNEYENDAKTYFAVPGDKPPALEQKRKARAAIMEGLKQESGRAYKEHYGEENTPAGKKAADPLGIR